MRLTRKTSLAAMVAAAAMTLAACGSAEPAATSTASTSSSSVGTSQAPQGSSSALVASPEVSSPEVSSPETSSQAPTEVLTGTLAAAGASSQNSAMLAWVAGYNVGQPGVTVNYDAVGSGGGREQFLAGGTQFAGTDSALKDDELEKSKNVCGPGGAIDIPVYISPIALPFNLEGISTLNLKPATIAQIFNKDITNWNDPAIAADNADVELPDLEIVPVNRSDDSGTSKNFQQYLLAAAAEAWPHPEAEDTWPVSGGEAANGTSGVIEVVSSTVGSIGYADASAVGQLGTIAVGVGNTFTTYSAEAAAAVVDVSPQAEGRSEHDLALKLARDTTESGVYPVVLVSYHVVCTNYADTNLGNMTKSFLNYVVSAEGQAASAEAAGSAPISDDLRIKVQAAIDSITVG